MTVGERIKILREEKEISQEKLANMLGYKSKTSIFKIEKNITDLPLSKVQEFAKVLNVSTAYLMGWEDEELPKNAIPVRPTKNLIPVLGRIAAGEPIYAEENIIDYIAVAEEVTRYGDHFALEVKGDSMLPTIKDGDYVIIKKQFDLESGEIGAIAINGNDVTLKKLIKQENGILIVANNPSVFESKFYTNKEVEKLPITILGKAIEVRSKL